MIVDWIYNRHSPWWKERLERCDNHIIKQTGYSRSEIEKIFETLHRYDVI